MVTRSVTRSVTQPVAIPFALAGRSMLRLPYRGASLSLAFDSQQYAMGAIGKRPAAFAFSDLITFTRSTGGGRFNAQGVYEWLPANQPRIDYDPVTGECRGLLIEEQRTNLLTYSSDFSNAVWNKTAVTITSNTSPSPSGLVDANKVIETTTNGQHELLRPISAAANSPHSCSIYMKKGERKYGYCGIYSAAGRNVIVVDLDTGEITQNNYTGAESFRAADVTYVGDGWYRLTVALTTSSTGFYSVFGPSATGNPAQINGRPSYQGDGTSGIYIWGAQLEAGSFPTSYIPTTTAQVTRAADVASVNVLSPWFNPEQGTLFVEAVPAGFAPSINTGWLSLDDGTTANLIEVRSWGPLKSIATGRAAAGAVGSIIEATNKLSEGAVARVALSYDAASGSLAKGGELIGSTAYSAAPSGIDRLRIGRRALGGPFTGHIRSLRYFPRRLSNTELQALTA